MGQAYKSHLDRAGGLADRDGVGRGGGDGEDEDRDAILRRRQRFIAIALSGLTGATQLACDGDDTTPRAPQVQEDPSPQVCLDMPLEEVAPPSEVPTPGATVAEAEGADAVGNHPQEHAGEGAEQDRHVGLVHVLEDPMRRLVALHEVSDKEADDEHGASYGGLLADELVLLVGGDEGLGVDVVRHDAGSVGGVQKRKKWAPMRKDEGRAWGSLDGGWPGSNLRIYRERFNVGMQS